MRRIFSIGLAVAIGVLARPAHAVPDPAAASPPSAASEIDKLYARLARTRFPDEAAGILAEIDHMRLQSGSDAADLLLARALKARESSDLPLALKLFDAVVEIEPDWSEAWSERAATRFMSGDVSGAMVDIAQTLKREPRDIAALAGLGALMLDSGHPFEALKVYDRALKLAPAYDPLKEARDKAQTEVWRRSP
jgi:tetratricopeptide (TPR) repeat protein